MLSEDKIEALQKRVAEWGAKYEVPEQVQQLVVEMGIQNPATDEDKKEICVAHLWSDAVIDWYDKFISYLASLQPAPEKPQTDLLLSLKTLRQLLDQIIEGVENGR